MNVLIACLSTHDLTWRSTPQPIRIGGNGKNVYFMGHCGGSDRARVRSRTFPGIARAMARQWAGEANV